MARSPRWWLQGLLVLVVGGLVYMHGIEPYPAAPLAGPAPEMTSNPGHEPVAAGHGDPQPAGGHGLHLIALCVAVLVASTTLQLARRLARHLGEACSRPASVRGRPTRGSDRRGPPGLRPPLLAVARC